MQYDSEGIVIVSYPGGLKLHGNETAIFNDEIHSLVVAKSVVM